MNKEGLLWAPYICIYALLHSCTKMWMKLKNVIKNDEHIISMCHIVSAGSGRWRPSDTRVCWTESQRECRQRAVKTVRHTCLLNCVTTRVPAAGGEDRQTHVSAEPHCLVTSRWRLNQPRSSYDQWGLFDLVRLLRCTKMQTIHNVYKQSYQRTEDKTNRNKL